MWPGVEALHIHLLPPPPRFLFLCRESPLPLCSHVQAAGECVFGGEGGEQGWARLPARALQGMAPSVAWRDSIAGLSPLSGTSSGASATRGGQRDGACFGLPCRSAVRVAQVPQGCACAVFTVQSAEVVAGGSESSLPHGLHMCTSLIPFRGVGGCFRVQLWEDSLQGLSGQKLLRTSLPVGSTVANWKCVTGWEELPSVLLVLSLTLKSPFCYLEKSWHFMARATFPMARPLPLRPLRLFSQPSWGAQSCGENTFPSPGWREPGPHLGRW